VRGMAVIEVRKAIEADCKYYIDIHCPEARAMSREERLRRCGYWADYDACVFYLGLYRRLSGEVFTALVDDDIVGEIELLPHDNCLLGPRAYINVLWVKESKRGIGVGTSLVREAVRWAQRKGYKYLDTIPEEQSIGFYSKMEFRRLALQVKALKQLKKTVASVDYEFMELSAGDTPTGMKLITGVYRPDLFTWCSAWKDKYLPPFPLSVSLYIFLSHCDTVSSVPPRLEGSPPRLIPWGRGWLSSPTAWGSHLRYSLRARSKAPITHMFMRITSTTHYKYYA